MNSPDRFCTLVPSMHDAADVQRILSQIQTDVPTIRALSLIELDSGIHYGAAGSATKFHLGTASVYASELMSLSNRAAHALGTQDSAEDVLLTLDDELHFLRFLPGRTTFLHVRADRRKTNVGQLRVSIDRHASGL